VRKNYDFTVYFTSKFNICTNQIIKSNENNWLFVMKHIMISKN
ncbi:hypothetical protein M153_2900002, partial [Pseudoloma neurophilia]